MIFYHFTIEINDIKIQPKSNCYVCFTSLQNHSTKLNMLGEFLAIHGSERDANFYHLIRIGRDQHQFLYLNHLLCGFIHPFDFSTQCHYLYRKYYMFFYFYTKSRLEFKLFNQRKTLISVKLLLIVKTLHVRLSLIYKEL